MIQTIDTDIVIVGAGLVGLSAAISLQSLGKRVVVVDAKQPDFKLPDTWDQRIYALTPGNVNWLRSLNVWDKVDTSRVSKIEAMHLWHDDAQLNLDSQDAHLPELGVIVEQQNLMHALGERLDATAVEVHYGEKCKAITYDNDDVLLKMQQGKTIKAQLLLGADSAQSWVREALGIASKQHDFAQTAIVANFKTEKPHRDIAYQWFRPHETLALLPLPNQHVSIVWALSNELAQQKLVLTPEALAREIGLVTAHLLGEMKSVGEVAGFPLKQLTATRFVSQRAALIGDAAHQVHPMAGQGVNLGFHDVIELTEQLRDVHRMMPLGDMQTLRRYERARKPEVAGMNVLTSGLDALFAMRHGGLPRLTQWGFKQIGQQNWLKKRLIERAVV
jgi:2-polyprenylphenol 6-hydroxylase